MFTFTIFMYKQMIEYINIYSQNPGKEHWKVLKRIQAYLKRTINYGLLFGGGSSELCGYCDSD